MGLRAAFAPLVMTVGLGVGTAYAVHESGELNREADQIEACLNAKETSIPFCFEHPMETQEVQTLRQSADTVGMLGWIAFGGSILTGYMALDLTVRSDPKD